MNPKNNIIPKTGIKYVWNSSLSSSMTEACLYCLTLEVLVGLRKNGES